MNKLNYEILSAIDNIETTVMESEMNVMNSLINTYDKAVMILENCNDNSDVSSYDIFQESVIMEADNNGKKKVDFKKAGKIILNILLWLPKQIMRFVKFIRRIVSKSKTLSPETINKAKQIVGDDTILITTTTTNSGGKPEVKVSSQSGDTQKEEEIKKNVDDALSKTVQQAHVVSFSTLEKSSETEIKVDGGEEVVEIEVTKDDVIVEYHCHYDLIKQYQKVFDEMKSLININDFIDIDFTDTEKYKDINSKLSDEESQICNINKNINLQFKKSTYAEYVKYYNDTVKIINDMVSSMEEFSNKLEKQINSEVDKMQALKATDEYKYNKKRIDSTVRNLKFIYGKFFDVLGSWADIGIQWFFEENEKVNKMVESIISERNS